MGKPDTRRLDRAIAQATSQLEAVRNREMWPLEGRERRAVLAGLAGGSYKVARGKSPARAGRKVENAWAAAEVRISAEIVALQAERQRIVTENAKDKAARKSSGWW
ncbi:hypothetical protein ABZ626_08760 [Streptomyces longispororuber]|uniref:hypothetical protein n=1 Tax=Streptomyces longispororuber TaxID=68230 RepID=UPI0033FE5669